MEQSENSTQNAPVKRNVMRDGTECKELFVKHISLADWHLIEKLKNELNMTTADVIRFAIRKTSGAI